MSLKNTKLTMDEFLREREEVMQTWPTGRGVDFEEGVRYQQALPESKRFSSALAQAESVGLDPGAPGVWDHILEVARG